VNFYVGITDGDWFAHLSQGEQPDEVNFWQPSARGGQFRALQPGEPFLFKLHSPRDYIVGGGFFSHYTVLPASFAWKAFGEKNGARTEADMRARIEHYRRIESRPVEDYDIGCILLQSPFFFTERDWIPLPDWPKSTVRGKGYDAETEPGRAVWDRVAALLQAQPSAPEPVEVAAGTEAKFGQPLTVLPRLGQGSFRVIVTDAYQRRCALTRSPVLHVLEAAHIKPFAQHGPHLVTNGLLLRQDFHTLMDGGYLTVTPEYRVEVSRRIREEFENGKEYYALHGSPISLPPKQELWPALEYLRWHNETKYLG
jgi:putative restriction endonuclease